MISGIIKLSVVNAGSEISLNIDSVSNTVQLEVKSNTINKLLAA